MSFQPAVHKFEEIGEEEVFNGGLTSIDGSSSHQWAAKGWNPHQEAEMCGPYYGIPLTNDSQSPNLCEKAAADTQSATVSFPVVSLLWSCWFLEKMPHF